MTDGIAHCESIVVCDSSALLGAFEKYQIALTAIGNYMSDRLLHECVVTTYASTAGQFINMQPRLRLRKVPAPALVALLRCYDQR
jgi:hypothetical protein